MREWRRCACGGARVAPPGAAREIGAPAGEWRPRGWRGAAAPPREGGAGRGGARGAGAMAPPGVARESCAARGWRGGAAPPATGATGAREIWGNFNRGGEL